MVIIILVSVLILFVIWFISIYNFLIHLSTRREQAYADIDVQLRQRYDLVPQLVETVRAYAKHEQNLLHQVTLARTQAMYATGDEERFKAEAQLSQALAGLRVAVEAYPDLKANANFLDLQQELSDLENKLAASRRFLNSATTELNTYIRKFPSNLVAHQFKFETMPLYNEDAQREELLKRPPLNFS